jgi:hypothetical protein
MIFFDHDRRRELLPLSLTGPEVQRAKDVIEKHRDRARSERAQTDLPPVWKQPLGHDVIDALANLSHRRCAFCERIRSDIEPYRFRPPGYAEPMLPPAGKDSYIWVAFAWTNFFPICRDCRPERPSYFPVNGDRAPYESPYIEFGRRLDEETGLFYPGELTQPARSFTVLATGELIGRGAKGKETTSHFNLNEERLVEERRDNIMMFLGDIAGSDRLEPDIWRSIFLEGEFGGARYLYLRRIIQMIAANRSGTRAYSLAPDRILESVERWRGLFDIATAFREAEAALRHEDRLEFFRQLKAHAPKGRRGVDNQYPPIASVEIRAFKSLENVEFRLPKILPPSAKLQFSEDFSEIRPEAPCLLILGENATGKSSILEAVALACLSPERVANLKLDPRKLTLNPEYMGAPGRLPIVQSKINVGFHEGPPRSCIIDTQDDAQDPIRHLGAQDEEPLVFAYGAHRLFGDERRRGPARHFDTLFLDNRQLSNPERWLRELRDSDEAALNEVISALRHIIQIDGEFETIEFPLMPTGERGPGIIRVRKTKPNGDKFIVPQPLAIVSSGFRAILAMVCDILEGLFAANEGNARGARNARAIVLIDEIEAHLHPRWKMHVISGLRRALPRTTFIITSHDPLCIRGMFNGEVMALNRYQNLDGDGFGLPERVEPVAGFENVEAMTIDQLLTSDLFQLMSTDDRSIERDFARMADILAADEAGLSRPSEKYSLERFRADIGEALPFGREEVPRLVQEAVAEYLQERRQANAAGASAAREAAKEAVKSYLRGLIG